MDFIPSMEPPWPQGVGNAISSLLGFTCDELDFLLNHTTRQYITWAKQQWYAAQLGDNKPSVLRGIGLPLYKDPSGSAVHITTDTQARNDERPRRKTPYPMIIDRR